MSLSISMFLFTEVTYPCKKLLRHWVKPWQDWGTWRRSWDAYPGFNVEAIRKQLREDEEERAVLIDIVMTNLATAEEKFSTICQRLQWPDSRSEYRSALKILKETQSLPMPQCLTHHPGRQISYKNTATRSCLAVPRVLLGEGEAEVASHEVVCISASAPPKSQLQSLLETHAYQKPAADKICQHPTCSGHCPRLSHL